MKRFLFFVLFIIGGLSAYSQVSVVATIDSIEMFIGQQVHVRVVATADEGANVIFPTFKEQQQIVAGIEVLKSSDEQKNAIDNGKAEFVRVYTLTSFDEKLYYLPPFTVKVGGKTYQSKSLALKVLAVPIDTTKMDKFFGPADVQDNPFLWKEWSGIFWLSILMILLIASAWYLNLRLRDNKPIIKYINVVKRLLPHQKAMKEIEEIKADRSLISENQKEYYTKLTDTLRRYIEDRYGFSAMEMTSTEIIQRLTASQDQKALDELRVLFETADLVKFAKYSTLINENDMNLVNAIEFINQTKQENVQTVETPKPVLSEEDKRSVKQRRTLKTIIITVSVICAMIFIYIIYALSQIVS